ncbi:unnamed protein product [Clavelina lepadiformis]
MAPSLAQANQRKWWIAITSVLENLMFAAVLLGWSSLLLMLKNEGFYSSVCTVDNEENDTTTSSELPNVNSSEKFDFSFMPSGKPTCPKQDEILNRCFSIGSCLLSAVTVLLGIIMDKYGSRMIRLCGTWTFMVSCVLLAVASMDTENLSVLIAPALCLNGMGGVVYIFTSFPVPNLFENLRSTMISLMIGSYSASAVMYMIFKAAYDAGVPFIGIMLFHAGIGFLTFLNCFFNTPGEPIPGPDDISYGIKLKFSAFRFEHKITGAKFLNHTSVVGRRMSSHDLAPSENRNYLESVVDLKGNETPSNQEESFLSVLATPCVFWSFVTMCLTQLRLIAYMGWLELYLKSSSKQLGLDEETAHETVEFYTLLFGLFQINCFLMAPVIGSIMDWNLKPRKQKKSKPKYEEISCDKEQYDPPSQSKTARTQLNGKPNEINEHNTKKSPVVKSKSERKRQQVMNMARAFMTTNILLIIFGIIILFERILPLQIVAFIVHTAVRTFLHSSTGGLYACM